MAGREQSRGAEGQEPESDDWKYRSMGDARTLRRCDTSLGRIDQYELVRELGGGGFGVVYLARDMVSGVDVAVKGLPPLIKNNAEELERIRTNFALVSRLHHPNIAAALVLHPAKDVSYASDNVRQALRVLAGDYLMVMSYAPGVTLSCWRRQFNGAKVPVAQAVDVCRQIALALDYSHSERIVHRDIKPSNVMVETLVCEDRAQSPGLSVKVLDFGLAAELRSSMSRVSQDKGETSGTRPYMAPEQWAGARQDGRADQYALAVLFHELVSGGVPFASAFDTGDPLIMAHAVEGKSPLPLAELSASQNAALLKALAKEPALRHASCTAFLEALAGRIAPRAGGGGSRKQWVFGLSAAALALAALAYGVAASRRTSSAVSPPRPEPARAEVPVSTQRQVTATAAASQAPTAAPPAPVVTAAAVRVTEPPKPVRDPVARNMQADAEIAYEKVRGLGAGQTFEERLLGLQQVWRQAEKAMTAQDWAAARTAFSNVLAKCAELTALETLRQHAKAQEALADGSRADAEKAGAAEDAETLFSGGDQADTRALAAFEAGQFAEAAKEWQTAVGIFVSAQVRAADIQSWRKAKAKFENDLGNADAAVLTRFGGAKWKSVLRLQQTAAAATNELAEGRLAYEEALALLPEAAAEARRAQHAETERAETERFEAQERFAREQAKARQAAWLAKAQPFAERLAREGLSARGDLARELLAAADALLAEAAGVDAARLEPADAQASAALLSRIKAQKAGVSAEHVSGDTKTVDLGAGVELVMMWCAPTNGFIMGSPMNERNREKNEALHRVTLTKGFWLGKTEVTQRQWVALMGSNPSHTEGDDLPVDSVSWEDCQKYLRVLNAKMLAGASKHERFRLPTEAEWEYACRAGRLGASGRALEDVAWFRDNSQRTTHPVGQKQPNAWGLCDMQGNVWEWCQDWFGDYPPGSVTDPQGGLSGTYRALRGGSWNAVGKDCRSAYRNWYSPVNRSAFTGFRLACDAR